MLDSVRHRSRSVLPMAAAFCIFALTVGSAWAWFHVNPREHTTRRRFQVRRAVPQYQFTNQDLAEGVLDELSVSTNDLVNGVYIRPTGSSLGDSERITVFYAGWAARSAREMSVVQHTPDICWIGAGAVPVALGQPSSVELELSSEAIPFECRVFVFPDGSKEMSLWCTLVGGQVYQEGLRFNPEKSATGTSSGVIDTTAARYAAGRRVGGNQFLNAVRERIPGTGDKQFIRFSTPVYGDDWQLALGRLRIFASSWLSIEVIRREKTSASGLLTPTPQ